MLKIFFIFASIVFVEGGFFDLTDVEDPLALLWQIPSIPQKKFAECSVDNTRKGVCMEKAKCLFTGGTPTGTLCGFMFTCCTYEESCFKTTDQKQSYFEVTDMNSAITSCRYTIKLRNKNVCQVRLDFEEFTLAPTTTTLSATGHNIFSCVNDELRITPHHYGVPTLCGDNSNQHLYIHVNQSTDTHKSINLDFNIANRSNQDYKYLPKPTWKIKFTQLECPLKRNKFDLFKYKEIDDIARDFNILAPQGAIQYFMEPQGEIKSFAFNTTVQTKMEEKTSYPYSEQYTIAFKKPSNVCGVRFTVLQLNLFESISDDCYHYLFIPELYQPGVAVDTNKKCSASVNDKFSSFSPGPLYINFKAMKTDADPTGANTYNQGFKLHYELLKYCPSVA